jgi:hypothetical protein
MSRLANYALAVLTCAGLVLAFGIGAAAEECNQRYKSCNLGCDQSVNAVEKVAVCKSRCDFRLIACDRLSVNSSAPTRSGSWRPVADGGNKR